MRKIFLVTLICAAGALYGGAFSIFSAKDAGIFVEFNCFDDVVTGYAKINFDDIGNQVSYNPNGHWNPNGRYWQNSIVHRDQVVVWESQRCLDWASRDAGISLREFIKICEDGKESQVSEIWIFDRIAGQLSRFSGADDGIVERDKQNCDPHVLR